MPEPMARSGLWERGEGVISNHFIHQYTYNGHTSVDNMTGTAYTIDRSKKGVAAMKAQNDVRVTFRVNRDLKEEAENLFDRLGMNMSTAYNIFLRKAVEESAIPFPVSSRSVGIGAGFAPADVTRAFELAVQSEIAGAQRTASPVARYDTSGKQAYLEHADGTRDYIHG